MTKPTIVVDTREIRPWLFQGYDCAILRKGLKQGDYSVVGLEDTIAIERKSLNDLVGTLTKGRERFFRELDRLRGYKFSAIIIESSATRVSTGPYPYSRAVPSSITGSLQAIALRYGTHVIFADSPKTAEQWAFGLLNKAWQYAELERKTSDDPQPDDPHASPSLTRRRRAEAE